MRKRSCTCAPGAMTCEVMPNDWFSAFARVRRVSPLDASTGSSLAALSLSAHAGQSLEGKRFSADVHSTARPHPAQAVCSKLAQRDSPVATVLTSPKLMMSVVVSRRSGSWDTHAMIRLMWLPEPRP